MDFDDKIIKYTSIALGPEILKIHNPERPRGVDNAKIVEGRNVIVEVMPRGKFSINIFIEIKPRKIVMDSRSKHSYMKGCNKQNLMSLACLVDGHESGKTRLQDVCI